MIKKAFTLIEVLLIVAIIAILAGIVILAVDPSIRTSDQSNAQRVADVNTVATAVYQYAVDNPGILPPSVNELEDGIPTEVCNTSFKSQPECDDLVDLSVLVQDNYLASIPSDPSVSPRNDGAGYQIVRTGDSITVLAPLAIDGEVISVTR